MRDGLPVVETRGMWEFSSSTISDERALKEEET